MTCRNCHIKFEHRYLNLFVLNTATELTDLYTKCPTKSNTLTTVVRNEYSLYSFLVKQLAPKSNNYLESRWLEKNIIVSIGMYVDAPKEHLI